MKYVAFLRGINVGGNSLVKMADLKKAFEARGFKNIQTILASGNVIFESKTADPEALTRKIETLLKKQWGRSIAVFVRTVDELSKMSALQPFKGVTIESTTRLYVTFLSENSRGLKLPELPSELRITRIKDDAVFSVLELSPKRNTTDSMAILEKAFGPRITTRNWNTIQKILKAAI